MQISKLGNSLAVRLPTSVIDALELKVGDNIDIRVAFDCAFEIAKKPSVSEFLIGRRAFRGKLTADFKFDRDSANER